MGSSYLGELRQNFRPLLAASIGLGTSLPFDAYVNSIFAAYLIKEFGWARSQFALYGLVALATVVVLPFVGRFADRFGVRRVALTGVVLMAVVFFGYSRMHGSFALFMVLSACKLIAGHMTSAVVYTRLVAANFDRARGLALTIINCTPAFLGALAAPILTALIEQVGWRQSYLLVGGFMLACGLVAVLLTPPGDAVQSDVQGHDRPKEPLAQVMGSRVFWTLAIAVYLIMISTPLQSSQLNILLEDNALAAAQRAWVISIFAISTIVGRIVCGLALDKFSPRVVAMFCTLPPALGFYLLATDWNAVGVIAFSMALAGFAVGAENDLFSFLVARHFRLEIYSSTLSLIFACVFMGTASGSLLISVSLAKAGSFSPFLYVVSAATLCGSLLFLLLPGRPHSELTRHTAARPGTLEGGLKSSAD